MADELKIEVVKLGNKPENNVVVGMSHFIKTVEDVHEVMVTSVPGAKFGLAFCEASGPRLVRTSGTDEELIREAERMAMLIGAGHVFVLVMREIYPINVLPKLNQVAEVVGLFCATANPVEVIVAESRQGRGVLGVIDGMAPKGVEKQKDKQERREFLRKIGYKL